jgi:hypothetical protein
LRRSKRGSSPSAMMLDAELVLPRPVTIPITDASAFVRTP